MTHPNISKNRLLAYAGLASAATGFTSSNTEAATVVNLNPGTRSYDTLITGIGTISLAPGEFNGRPKSTIAFENPVNLYAPTGGQHFVRGAADESATVSLISSFNNLIYSEPEDAYGNSVITAKNGAELNSGDNWFFIHAISPDEDNPVDGSAWVQVYLDGTNTGYLQSLVIPDFEGELPTAGSAAAFVPEPSSLILLSLGATGLVMRRKRKTA